MFGDIGNKAKQAVGEIKKKTEAQSNLIEINRVIKRLESSPSDFSWTGYEPGGRRMYYYGFLSPSFKLGPLKKLGREKYLSDVPHDKVVFICDPEKRKRYPKFQDNRFVSDITQVKHHLCPECSKKHPLIMKCEEKNDYYGENVFSEPWYTFVLICPVKAAIVTVLQPTQAIIFHNVRKKKK